MYGQYALISEHNIKAVERTQSETFTAAYNDLTTMAGRKGIRLTHDEKRRLAALACFVKVGVVSEEVAKVES